MAMAETKELTPNELLPWASASYVYRVPGVAPRYLNETEGAVDIAFADRDVSAPPVVWLWVNKRTHVIRDIPAGEWPELAEACAHHPDLGAWRVALVEPREWAR